MKRFIIITSILTALVTASRIPFLEKTPFEWDSVNLLFGVERFDIIEDRPHPPGYIGYIAAGKAVNCLLNDTHQALLLLNLIFTILLAAGVYFFCRMFISKNSAVIAMLIVLFNPIVWFYGEIVNTYLAGAAVWVWITLMIFQLKKDQNIKVFFSGLLLGAAGSFRPDVSLFLLPALLYSIKGYYSAKTIAGIFGGFILGTMIWLIPTIILTKMEFIDALMTVFSSTTGKSSIFMGAPTSSHLAMLMKGVVWFMIGAGWIIPLFIIRITVNRKPLDSYEKMTLISVLPLLIFQSAFLLVKAGYILLYLPSMILLGVKLMADHSKSVFSKKLSGYYTIAIIFLSASYFLFWPSERRLPGYIDIDTNYVKKSIFKLSTVSRSRIAWNDSITLLWTSVIKRSYQPEEAVIYIFGEDFDWRLASYHLRDYIVVQLTGEKPLEITQVGYKGRIYCGISDISIGFKPHINVYMSERYDLVLSQYAPPAKFLCRYTPEGVRWTEIWSSDIP